MSLSSFVLFFFSLLNIIDFRDPDNSNETVKTLEGHLIYYYIRDNSKQVESMLQQILALSEATYKRDNEIVNYWYFIDNEMTLHEGVAPDGLPTTSDHAFVVLGYALNADGSLRPEAKGRCDVAFESSKKYPNSMVYLTGGGTASANKTATEAGQMKEYLVNVKGLDPNRIVLEKEAKDTIQNARNTIAKLIDNNIKTITVITSDYHLRRGSILFKSEAMVKAESLGITPIEVLENAVYKTGKSTEGKSMEGYALASILGVKVGINLIANLLPNIITDALNYYFS